MAKAERLVTLGLEELTAVNNMLAERPDKVTRDIKERVANDLVRMLRKDPVELPLKGFAITAIADSNNIYWSGNSQISYHDETFKPVDSRSRTHDGKWIEPDRYWIGGDYFSYTAGHCAMLRPVPHGPQSNIKRYQVIVDSVGIATPEEIAPAEAIRDINRERLDAMWSRIMAHDPFAGIEQS
jgi:hypothetical protein